MTGLLRRLLNEASTLLGKEVALASFCRETRKKSYGCDMGQVFSVT